MPTPTLPPNPWIRPVQADPAVVLGESLRTHLPPERLARLVRTLPGGAVMLRRYPRAARNPGAALQAVWEEGLASQFRARAAALSVSLLAALNNAGWEIPPSDPYGNTSATLTPPLFVWTFERVARTVRQGLTEQNGPPVVLAGADRRTRMAVTALLVEDPRTRLAFPGGIFVAAGDGAGGLLDVLRDVGSVVNHPPLARAVDAEQGLHHFRSHFQQQPVLLVLTEVSDIASLRRLWGGLGAQHRLVLSVGEAIPDSVPAKRVRISVLSLQQAWEQFALWAGPVAGSAASQPLAQVLALHPGLAVCFARLIGGPHPWLSPTHLVRALASVERPDDPNELADAALSVGLQTAPPVLAETMLALSVLPPAPAVLPDDLLCTVVGVERWIAVRGRLATAGFVVCVDIGRWQIPPVVSQVVRRQSAQVPQLATSARRAAVHWARQRLQECASDWNTDGAVSLRLRELRTDRQTIVGIIGRDPLGSVDSAHVPFGLIAWLLPHGQVRTLIARSSKLAGHPWRSAAWRWLADDLLRTECRKDAARLLAAVVEDARRTGDEPERLEASLQLAQIQCERGDVVDARALLEGVVRDAGALGSPLHEARASLALGELLDISGDLSGSVQAYWRAVALFRDSGQHSMAAEATGQLGLLAQRSGNTDVAAERFRMQAALADSAQDRSGVTTAESRLGRLAWSTGNAETAVHWLGRALKGWEQGHAGQEPEMLLLADFSEALLATGRVEAALATCRRRIDAAQAVGDLADETAAVREMARILSITGARAEALQLLADALRRDRAFGDRRGEAQHLLAAGNTHDPRRAPRQAVVCFEAAHHVAEELGWREGVARALAGVATAEAALGQLPMALRDGRGALAIYRRLGKPHAVARWEVQFGSILVASGHPNEGRRLLSTGANTLTRLGWSRDRINRLVTGSTPRSKGA